LKFIRDKELLEEGNWLNAMESGIYRSWSGYAFELVCLTHIPTIKKALSIGGVISQSVSWRSKNDTEGAQINLLIDRRDHVINLCEIKFSQQTFSISKAYAEQLEQKVRVFKEETKTNKAVWLTMITTYGLVKNEYEARLVQYVLTLDDMFAK
jgi:uncharacterized protein